MRRPRIAVAAVVSVLLLLMAGAVRPTAAQVTVRLPDTTASTSQSIRLPVRTDSLDGKDVLSYEFTVEYDASDLEVTGVETSGTLSEGRTVVANTDSTGEVSVSMGGTTALDGEGVLVYLTAETKTEGTSDLRWASFRFNEGTPSADPQDGSITVGSPERLGVSFPDTSGTVGQPVHVPVRVDSTDGTGVTAYSFSATFDADVLTVTGTSTAGTLSEGYSVEMDTSATGKVSVSAAGTDSLSGAGVLLYLTVEPLNSGTTPLSWSAFTFNEGSPEAVLTDGQFEAVEPDPIRVRLPDTTEKAGQATSVPVRVEDVTDRGVYAYNFTIQYDERYIDVSGAQAQGTLSEGYSVEIDTSRAGEISVSAAGSEPLSGAGTLVDLTVEARRVGTSALVWKHLTFNEGQPPARTEDGRFKVSGIRVVVPDTTEESQTVQLPIRVNNRTDEELYSYSFTLTYDAEVMAVVGASADGTLSSGYSVEVDTSTAGQVTVAAAGTDTLAATGTLVYLETELAPVGSSPVRWQEILFNEGTAGANTVDGTIDAVSFSALPPAPPSLVEKVLRRDSLVVRWRSNAEPDINQYRIYRDTAPIDSTAGPEGIVPYDSVAVGDTAFVDSSVQANTTYYYRVTAVDNAGNESGFSGPGDVTAPDAPPSLAAEASPDSVSLQWDASEASDVVRYHLYRDTTPIDPSAAPSSLAVLKSAAAGTTTIVDTTAENDSTYYYRVTAVDSASNQSGFSAEAVAELPGAPVVTVEPATGVKDSSATLQARANPNGDSTTVSFQYGTRTDYGQTATGTESPLRGTTEQPDSTQVVGLQPDTEYHYRAIASNDVEADTTADQTFWTEPSPPMVATDSVEDVTTSSATVFGTVNPGGDTTAAKVRFFPEGEASVADTVQAAESPLDTTVARSVRAPIEDLEPGQSYAAQVLATNSAGTATGAEVSFSTTFLPPTARPDTARVRRGRSRTVAVLANDEAGAGLDSSTVSVETTPTHGTASVNDATGTITYEHDGSDSFTDSFTYTVTDEAGQRSEPATVHLNGFDVEVQADPSLPGPAPVTVVVEGEIDPTESTLYARKGGASSYEAIDLTRNATDPLELAGEVPAPLVTSRGVDYYVVLATRGSPVTVPPGGREQVRARPAHLPVSFDEIRAPVSFQPEAYRMVTVPAKPEEGIKAALQESYGNYDRSEWRVLRWDAETGGDSGEGASGEYREYPQIDSLEAGEAFWLITAGGDSLTVESGETVDAATPRKIALEAGWNQVGSPFGFAVPWSAVLDSSGLSGEAVDGPVAWREGDYQRGQSILRAWEGYFVFSAGRDTLRVPPVGTGSQAEQVRGTGGPVALRGTAFDRSGSVGESRSTASPSQKRPSAGTPYTVRIDAQGKEMRGRPVWLGLRPAAKEGRDRLDFAQAPSIGPTVRLSIQEEVDGRAVPHSGSFKPPAGEGQTWQLQLANPTEAAHDIHLRWKSDGRLPDGFDRYVLDLNNEHRMATGQSLRLDAGETRSLEVIVGTESFAKEESGSIGLGTFKNELRGNYPNPFGQETTIAYTLAEEQTVTIEVFNVLGQRVRTLVKGERQAGLHRLRWKGENQYGTPVGSGVYFYRIEAGSFTETRRMVLVR